MTLQQLFVLLIQNSACYGIGTRTVCFGSRALSTRPRVAKHQGPRYSRIGLSVHMAVIKKQTNIVLNVQILENSEINRRNVMT
jgi:hypothetical protein